MSFGEAVGQLPEWIRVWVIYLAIVTGGSIAILIASRRTWDAAAAIVAANALMIPSVLWLHGELGYVRLIGAPHLVFWTPLVAFLVWRLRSRPETGHWQRAAVWMLALSLTVSLGFDLVDTLRWLAGERAPMVGPG